ncbi:hypothetical protein FB107DRAFT_280619 [Schizophyllum commune]
MPIFSCEPEPPEARVRTPRAKDAKVKGPSPSHPIRAGSAAVPEADVISTDPKPPEACARTLGEGCERGGVPLPTGTGPGRDAASLWMHILTAGGMHAHPRRRMRKGWGTPSPPHGMPTRCWGGGGTAPFVEGNSVLIPRRG